MMLAANFQRRQWLVAAVAMAVALFLVEAFAVAVVMAVAIDGYVNGSGGGRSIGSWRWQMAVADIRG